MPQKREPPKAADMSKLLCEQPHKYTWPEVLRLGRSVYSREAQMVPRSTILICSAALIGTAAFDCSAQDQVAHSEQPKQQLTKPNSHATPQALVRDGKFFGAAPDPRVRSYLQQNGLPE